MESIAHNKDEINPEIVSKQVDRPEKPAVPEKLEHLTLYKGDLFCHDNLIKLLTLLKV
jgi:hypothetical protein